MLTEVRSESDAAQFPWLLELWARCQEIPLYRARVAGAGSGPGGFFQLPFVTKREMRENFPHNFLRPGQELETLLGANLVELEYTSGTSEDRVPVLLERGWWERQERRALELNPFVRAVLRDCSTLRRATLTTPACNGVVCPSRWLTRAQRTLGGALSLNQARIPFLLTPAEQSQMAAEVTDWAPTFLDCDPVHGVWFARYCERQGIRFPSLKFVLCSYEFVSVTHRRIIERALGVPVFNLYGATETGHLLMESAPGQMQASAETAFLEVVDANASGVGDLVVTTLTNGYMPLVRYHIGDLVARRGDDYLVHGRKRDALQTAPGQRVTTWQVDQCFAGLAGIAHYQLRQLAVGQFHLRYIGDGVGPDDAELRQLICRLEKLLHAHGQITSEAVDVLVPSPSGKFRLTLPHEN